MEIFNDQIKYIRQQFEAKEFSSENYLLSIYHSLNEDRQQKLVELAKELYDLGYIKG